MPATAVYFYAERHGDVPVVDWLKELRKRNKKAYAKCDAAIEMLRMLGHELRRPHADFLRDGIYELRARTGNVHFRLLYFFHGRNVAILHHALAKEGKMPEGAMDKAIERKARFEKDPGSHIFDGELDNDE